jgi:signal peptidase II
VSDRAKLLIRALALSAAVVAVDQISKQVVVDNVARGETAEVLPFLDIANSRNTGVAFGLAEGISPVLIGAAMVLLVGLLVYLSSRSRGGWEVWVPAGLLLGGALGNLIDRAREGAVIDFIDFSFWPTFNLADAAIVCGVALLVLAPEMRRE